MDFEKDTKEELDKRRRAAKTVPIVPVSEVSIKLRNWSHSAGCSGLLCMPSG